MLDNTPLARFLTDPRPMEFKRLPKDVPAQGAIKIDDGDTETLKTAYEALLARLDSIMDRHAINEVTETPESAYDEYIADILLDTKPFRSLILSDGNIVVSTGVSTGETVYLSTEGVDYANITRR